MATNFFVCTKNPARRKNYTRAAEKRAYRESGSPAAGFGPECELRCFICWPASVLDEDSEPRDRDFIACGITVTYRAFLGSCQTGRVVRVHWLVLSARRSVRTGCCLLLCAALLIAGCASRPPGNQHDLCEVFRQHPDWYDAARESQQNWGVPIHIQMAFVHHESGYRSHAKPPFDWFLFIPLGRPSSAQGFAQIQDPAWDDYRKERGSWFRSRSDIDDALDFVGWYNHRSHELLGISKWDARNLYLAYHEGHTGYRRGSYRSKRELLRVADRVDRTAGAYGEQLRRCEQEFRCRKWYQFGPFCNS